MASPASLDFPGPRVNPALDSLVLQVYPEYLEAKVYPDPREILVSPAAPDHQGVLDLMVHQDLKVTLVYLVTLELVAHQDHLTLAHLGPRVFPDPQVQWVPLGSQAETEGKETPDLQV